VAKEMGISRQCAHRWVKRYDEDGWAGLCDRSSRPHRVANRTSAAVEIEVLRVREDRRCGRDQISRDLGVPARTVSRILHRHGMPALAALDPITGEVIRTGRATTWRYERDQPGDLIHVDVKKLGRIPDGGGWRVQGRAASVEHQHKKTRIGLDYVHAAIDDHTRLAYAEILPRAAAWFTDHGIQITEHPTPHPTPTPHPSPPPPPPPHPPPD